MTYLRHAVRHIRESVLDRIHDGLTADGWLGPDVPFGAVAVQWVPTRMKESDLYTVDGNIVSVGFGSEPASTPLELGGGLIQVDHLVLVDVVAVEDSLSLAIAADIQDRMSGLKPDTSCFEPVYDYTAEPRTAVVGWQIEFTDVRRVEPGGEDRKRNWNVVSSMCEVTLEGNE